MSTTMRTVITSMEDRVSVGMRSCGSASELLRAQNVQMTAEQARRKTREDAARSKTGVWGPTHSADSDEEQPSKHHVHHIKKGGGSDTTKEETTASDETPSPPRRTQSSNPLNRLYESAVSAMTPTSMSIKRATSSCLAHEDQEETHQNNTSGALRRPAEILAHLDPCSPCSNPHLDSPPLSPNPVESSPPQQQEVEEVQAIKTPESGVTAAPSEIVRDLSTTESAATPASRRRLRHMERLKTQARLEMDNAAPVKKIEVQALDVERSISELTMRSSYGEATAKLAEHRRMAYYAVGKHHGRAGGNRRCYFTGKLILGGAPFYAGSVQQGLRTLVVFCLPSALGLPQKEGQSVDMKRQRSMQSIGSVRSKGSASRGFSAQPRSLIRRARSSTASRLSSLDDMSLSYEEESDINDGLDREYLLTVLPAPSQDLLDAMSDRYPEQFETLPVQVRSPHCWRLFIKFCFFSGLPIAEGEMHYKVRDQVAEVYGEEIILSHEVMEAVNGSSAEILRLPNQKTFKYLQKHYTQQCGKLSQEVFQRQSWEVVLPEI